MQKNISPPLTLHECLSPYLPLVLFLHGRLASDGGLCTAHGPGGLTAHGAGVKVRQPLLKGLRRDLQTGERTGAGRRQHGGRRHRCGRRHVVCARRPGLDSCCGREVQLLTCTTSLAHGFWQSGAETERCAEVSTYGNEVPTTSGGRGISGTSFSTTADCFSVC